MAVKVDKDLFKSLSRNDKLVPHLDLEIAKGEFDWSFDYTPKVEDDAWHPSGDCTPSVHDLWLKATGAAQERPISGSLRKTFMVGHFWHAYIQWIVVAKLGLADYTAIERKGCKVWCDNCSGAPDPFWWTTGSGDIAPLTIPEHGEYLVDIKTMNGHAFAGSAPPAWAADKWECQVNIYMDFFDLEKALILCVQKDSPHEFKEFEFEANPDLVDAIYKKWKLVGRCLADGTEPDIDYEVPLPLTGPVR